MCQTVRSHALLKSLKLKTKHSKNASSFQLASQMEPPEKNAHNICILNQGQLPDIFRP